MKKYRIKEYIRADGSSFFEIQERFLFVFWCDSDCWMTTHDTKEKAEKVIADLESRKIIAKKIHK